MAAQNGSEVEWGGGLLHSVLRHLQYAARLRGLTGRSSFLYLEITICESGSIAQHLALAKQHFYPGRPRQAALIVKKEPNPMLLPQNVLCTTLYSCN